MWGLFNEKGYRLKTVRNIVSQEFPRLYLGIRKLNKQTLLRLIKLVNMRVFKCQITLVNLIIMELKFVRFTDHSWKWTLQDQDVLYLFSEIHWWPLQVEFPWCLWVQKSFDIASCLTQTFIKTLLLISEQVVIVLGHNYPVRQHIMNRSCTNLCWILELFFWKAENPTISITCPSFSR